MTVAPAAAAPHLSPQLPALKAADNVKPPPHFNGWASTSRRTTAYVPHTDPVTHAFQGWEAVRLPAHAKGFVNPKVVQAGHTGYSWMFVKPDLSGKYPSPHGGVWVGVRTKDIAFPHRH